MSAKYLRSRLGGFYRRTAGGALFRRPFQLRRDWPLISFTFDDFPQSALFTGGAILNRFGLTGTYYASFGIMGKDSPSGRIFLADDLKILIEQGHELGCHTFDHLDSWQTDRKTFERSVLENRRTLSRLLPGVQFKNFSYPISLPRPLTKVRVGRYFLSARGGGQKFNVERLDLNQLAAFFLEKSRHDIRAIKDLIDKNLEARGWLIFATHDISANPTPFGCTPDFFSEVVQYAVESGSHILTVEKALEALNVPGARLSRPAERPPHPKPVYSGPPTRQPALVSILIPAYNAERWIADTLRSAIEQTWSRKEIIVVDDGSRDETLAIARQFESSNLRVVAQRNRGAAAARNTALSLCRGKMIQWLDADDILAPDKIERQMAVWTESSSKAILLSSEFGRFLHQWRRAQFVPTELWEDLSPVEWLLRKLDLNLYMQTATWLVSRELTEASGAWDTRMLSDDDGEYFCRVLLNSDGTRFVPGAKVFYRGFRPNSLAYVGKSDRKRDALWLSMKLHMGYMRSLEDCPRVRQACLRYIQRNLINFYPERSDILAEAEQLAAELGGRLAPPCLSWKYSWIKAAFGWQAAKNISLQMRKIRWSVETGLDKAIPLAFLNFDTDKSAISGAPSNELQQ